MKSFLNVFFFFLLSSQVASARPRNCIVGSAPVWSWSKLDMTNSLFRELEIGGVHFTVLSRGMQVPPVMHSSEDVIFIRVIASQIGTGRIFFDSGGMYQSNPYEHWELKTSESGFVLTYNSEKIVIPKP